MANSGKFPKDPPSKSEGTIYIPETIRHRKTDPACNKFNGTGKTFRIGKWVMRSLKRVRFDRALGKACYLCGNERALGS